MHIMHASLAIPHVRASEGRCCEPSPVDFPMQAEQLICTPRPTRDFQIPWLTAESSKRKRWQPYCNHALAGRSRRKHIGPQVLLLVWPDISETTSECTLACARCLVLLLTWILSNTTSCLDARWSAKANGDFESSTFRSCPMSAFLSRTSFLARARPREAV